MYHCYSAIQREHLKVNRKHLTLPHWFHTAHIKNTGIFVRGQLNFDRQIYQPSQIRKLLHYTTNNAAPANTRCFVVHIPHNLSN